jgi:cell wall-associated NlpC family hydrolase
VLDDAHIHAPTLVEPNSGRGRPNRMFADTDPIRAFGAANSAQAADLGAVAAALSSMPGHAAGAMLGPVGTRFLAALADAVVQGPCAVATLSDRMEAGHLTTYASAGAGSLDHPGPTSDCTSRIGAASAATRTLGMPRASIPRRRAVRRRPHMQEQDVGSVVDAGSMRPGDLAVWDGHVAMIVGNGTMIEAGDPVKLSPIRTSNAGQGFQGFWRPTA